MIDAVEGRPCQTFRHGAGSVFEYHWLPLLAGITERQLASRPLASGLLSATKFNGPHYPHYAVPSGASPQMEARRMQVERILREYGQFLRPMVEAPRDGQRILGRTTQGGLIFCYWEPHPAGLIGPNWVEERDSPVGYVDRFFDGWIRLSDFRLLDTNAINRLLVAYIDDARAAEDRSALDLLDGAVDRPDQPGQQMVLPDRIEMSPLPT